MFTDSLCLASTVGDVVFVLRRWFSESRLAGSEVRGHDEGAGSVAGSFNHIVK